jgi:hypothetical protein
MTILTDEVGDQLLAAHEQLKKDDEGFPKKSDRRNVGT